MNLIFKLMAVAGMAATFALAQDNAQASQQTGANSKMGVGVRIAFDYSRMYGFDEEDDDMDKNPSGIGFEGGVMGRIGITDIFGFTPEIDINYTSLSHDYLSIKRTYTNLELQIPLMLRGTIKNRFFVNAGPQVNFALSSDFDTKTTKEDRYLGTWDSYIKENVEEKAFSFGLVVGGGVNIIKGLNADFRFYLGLSELYDLDYDLTTSDNYSQVDMSGAKMMAFKIGLSYWIL